MFSPTRRTRRMVPASALDKPADRELPLQLALAWLFVCATPMAEQDAPPVAVYSPGFVSDILNIIAREAFEVNPKPATFASLQEETNKLLYWEQKELTRINERRRQRGQHVLPAFEEAADRQPWLESFQDQFAVVTDGTDLIDVMERLLRIRISEAGEEAPDVPEPLERKSPLGVYFRTLLVSLRKLSFHETTALAQQVGEWCGARQAEETQFDTDHSYTVTANPLTTLEERAETRGAASSRYKEAVDSGDYVTAVSSLRQFYDYPAKPGENDGAMFPHALLNLATFYYYTGGLSSARDTLEEAIRSARAHEDLACLQKCMSLRHRVVTESDAAAWPGAEVPQVRSGPVPLRRLMKSITPMDDLWSVKAAVDLGEPIPVAFRRIHTALGRTLPHKPLGEEEDTIDDTLNIAEWHVAQAGLWSLLGSNALADRHETMALGSDDLEDDSYLSVQIARAERASLRGDFDQALSLLLDSETVERLAFPAYRRWARTVWSVLERQASLATDAEAQTIISSLRADPASISRQGPGGPERDIFDPSYTPKSRGIVFAHEHIRTSLQKVRDLRAPPHLILRDVLAALELAAGLSLWPLYRHGTVLLAETLLALEGSGSGMAAKADAELEAIWDALLCDADAEIAARGAMVRAKAATVVVLRDEDESALQRAMKFASLAISKAAEAGARHVQIEAGALRSMLAQLAGESVPEPEVPEPALAERVRRVAEIVRLVGVRVSEGWQ